MARPMIVLVVFFVSLNLFSGVLIGTGTAAMLGLDGQVGQSDAIDSTVANSGVDTGSATGSTLFGSYQVLTNQLSNIFGAVFPGLVLLRRAGVPTAITGGILGPLFTLFSTFGVVFFFRGLRQ